VIIGFSALTIRSVSAAAADDDEGAKGGRRCGVGCSADVVLVFVVLVVLVVFVVLVLPDDQVSP
jgi:hypothetical protein